MDSETKELFKKILSKVENLEKEIQELKESGKYSPSSQNFSKFPPIKTKDRLTKVLIEKAREKVVKERVEGERSTSDFNKKSEEEKIREIRENFDLGEIALFAIKRGMIKRGSPEEASGTGTVVIKE